MDPDERWPLAARMGQDPSGGLAPDAVARRVQQAMGKGRLALLVTDAAGRRWNRYPDGRLVEPDRPRRRSRKDFYNAWIAGEVDQLDY
jgi:hypothetical protein